MRVSGFMSSRVIEHSGGSMGCGVYVHRTGSGTVDWVCQADVGGASSGVAVGRGGGIDVVSGIEVVSGCRSGKSERGTAAGDSAIWGPEHGWGNALGGGGIIRNATGVRSAGNRRRGGHWCVSGGRWSSANRMIKGARLPQRAAGMVSRPSVPSLGVPSYGGLSGGGSLANVVPSFYGCAGGRSGSGPSATRPRRYIWHPME